MPPWHASTSEGGPFVGARVLSEAEKKILAAWAEASCPEGDPRDEPPAKSWSSDWALGPPDLVLEIPEAYTLDSAGRDEHRVFVIRSGLMEGKWVKAVDFRPGNPQGGASHPGGLRRDRARSLARQGRSWPWLQDVCRLRHAAERAAVPALRWIERLGAGEDAERAAQRGRPLRPRRCRRALAGSLSQERQGRKRPLGHRLVFRQGHDRQAAPGRNRDAAASGAARAPASENSRRATQITRSRERGRPATTLICSRSFPTCTGSAKISCWKRSCPTALGAR